MHRRTVLKAVTAPLLTMLVGVSCLGGTASADSSVNRIMAMDQNGQVYSQDGSSPTWYQQIGSPTTANIMATGGTRMVAEATNSLGRFLYSKNQQQYGWLPFESGGVGPRNSFAFVTSNGGPQLSVGPTGETMIINQAGNAFVELDDGRNNWVQESSGGLAAAVAVGGLPGITNTEGGQGRMMMIDWAGTTWSKDLIDGAWVKQTASDGSTTHAIAVGPQGEMMAIDSMGSVYAKYNTYDAWIPESSNSGGANKAIAVGGKHRMMLIDPAGNAYSKDSLTGTWVLQVTGAKAIAVGTTGRMVAVDSANQVYFKDNTFDAWTPDPISGYGNPPINYISIN